MKVKDVMATTVVTVSPDNSVRRAAGIMLDKHVSGLPVVDDKGMLVGLISEGDLLRRSELGLPTIAASEHLASSEERANAYVKSHAWKVGDVMSRNVITVDEEADLSRVATLMAENGVKRLPVIRNGKLVSIVSRADLLHAIATARFDDTAAGDEAIRRSIVTRLNEDIGLKSANVTVTVVDGLVHLWGTASAASRKAACVVAEGVRGVKGVIEHFPDAGGRSA
ncbi:CBS domain-containing protein [Mesorhizobium muleiense]|uniref:CBS domain-containing protein n=1 Tax=Mesorhizobium muleiense TaxID=1004279 RepID=UPI003AFA8D42